MIDSNPETLFMLLYIIVLNNNEITTAWNSVKFANVQDRKNDIKINKLKNICT